MQSSSYLGVPPPSLLSLKSGAATTSTVFSLTSVVHRPPSVVSRLPSVHRCPPPYAAVRPPADHRNITGRSAADQSPSDYRQSADRRSPALLRPTVASSKCNLDYQRQRYGQFSVCQERQPARVSGTSGSVGPSRSRSVGRAGVSGCRSVRRGAAGASVGCRSSTGGEGRRSPERSLRSDRRRSAGVDAAGAYRSARGAPLAGRLPPSPAPLGRPWSAPLGSSLCSAPAAAAPPDGTSRSGTSTAVVQRSTSRTGPHSHTVYGGNGGYWQRDFCHASSGCSYSSKRTARRHHSHAIAAPQSTTHHHAAAPFCTIHQTSRRSLPCQPWRRASQSKLPETSPGAVNDLSPPPPVIRNDRIRNETASRASPHGVPAGAARLP